MDPSVNPDSPPPAEDLPPGGLPSAEAIPSPVPVAEPPLIATAPAPARFVFHGEAREYFRVWIVNTLLSVLTLGVFNAWAKVRKRRYLRGNTELLGHRFDYTASPRRILVGNIIILVFFLAYALFGAVYPMVRVGALLVFIGLLPWIVVRSLAFNAHHTVYRGMRFRFHPSVSAAVMLYLMQSLVIIVTLGIYYPAWLRARQEFVICRHRLGTARFSVTLKSGTFYRIYLVAAGMIFIGAVLGGVVFGSWTVLSGNAGRVPTLTQLVPFFLCYGAAFYVAKQFIFAETFKANWNAARLGEHRFRTTLHTDRWIVLQLVNLGAMIATAGLAYPWAVVRSARYTLSSLELVPAGPLGEIAVVGGTEGSAVGDTAAEFAGLDFGL